MAWIELHQTLPTNKKTKRLKNFLKIKNPQAIGHLCLLWLWSIDNAPDGDLSGFTDEEISDVVEWNKSPDLFIAALINSGFLDEDKHIHDWYDYAGKLIDKRKANAKRMRDARAKNVQCTCEPCAGATVPNSTVPYPTVPNSTVQNNTKDNDICAEQGSPPSESKPVSVKEKYPVIYSAVISYLNEKAGTSYKPSTKSTQEHIRARQTEGFTLEDFKRVIDNKCAEWLTDSKMKQYLRPETLFSTKFEWYLNNPKLADRRTDLDEILR